MTDPIYATLKGPFIPDDLYSLKVLSRHQGIINLLDREKELVTSLIKDKKNMTGMSLLVPDLFDMLADQNIEIKTDAQWQNRIFIDYQNTEIWPDTPAIHQMDLYPRLIELDIIKQKIKAGDSFLALLTNQYTTAFQKKGKDILENHIKKENGKLKGLKQLVGLGQGLTPSGDDFITGALLAAICGNSSVPIDKKAIENKLPQTTYAGRTLLTLALKNSFPAYLLTFVEEVSVSIKEKNVMAAAQKAAHHGATSGLDSLAGFYWYYQLKK